MTYTIRHNTRTTHIDGLTKADGTPACAALHRHGNITFAHMSGDDIKVILEKARIGAKVNMQKLCRTCERAAEAAIADAVADAVDTWIATRTATDAENTTSAVHEAPAEAPAGRVDGLRICTVASGLRGAVHDGYRTSSGTWATCGTGGGTGWGEIAAPGAPGAVTCKRCLSKIADAEANAAADRKREERWFGAGADADAVRAYELAYREAKYMADRAALVSDDEADQAAEASYERYREAADKIDRCLVFGCEATTGPYRCYCAEHDAADDEAAPPVLATATVDHTEPGKAAAAIHGQRSASARLTLENRGWVLVDDEDETITVNAIGVDVAVTEWAHRKGLGHLRSITINYAYAAEAWSPLAWRDSEVVHLGRRGDDGTLTVLCGMNDADGWRHLPEGITPTCLRCLGAAGNGLTPAAD